MPDQVRHDGELCTAEQLTEYLRISFPNLPDSFDGYRICHISDLHAGFWVKKDYLMEMVRIINGLNGDLVVITGDIITGAVNDFWKRWMPVSSTDYTGIVIDVLKNLKADNKMAVLGNHDQWDGKKSGNDPFCVPPSPPYR